METNKKVIPLFNQESKASIRIGDTVIHIDKNGRYCLNDLHESSGGEKRHRPAYFLATQQAKELIGLLSKADFPAIEAQQKTGTFAKKEIVYAYAIWISTEFYLHVIQTYDKKVTEEHAQLEALQAKLKTSIPKDPDCISSVIGGSPLEAHEFYKVMQELDLITIQTDYRPIYKKFITEKGWAYCQGYSKDGIIRIDPEMHNALMALVAKFGEGNQVDIFDISQKHVEQSA
jgi:hypothetical protein